MHSYSFNTKVKQTLKPKNTINNKQIHSLTILSMDLISLYKMFQDLVRNCYFHYNFISSTPINLIENNAYKSVLQDHLLLQLHTLKQTYNNTICTYIIENIDDNGFLEGKISDHCHFLSISESKFMEQLYIIQSLEPDGVGARNPLESIIIQLKKDNQDFAIKLLKYYSQEIESHNYQSIANKENCSIDEIEDAMYIIKETNPFPGLCFIDTSRFTPSLIIPDFYLLIDNNELFITPSKQTSYLNELHLNKEILSMPEFKNFMADALFSIDSLTKRNTTLLLVTNELIKKQKDHFLEQKPLKRCTMQSIAKEIGISVSTISRCIDNKYIEFNNDIISIRSLFISKKCENDEDIILKEIKNIILNENKNYPYSDYEISLILKKRNINISRRTINKYRDILNIPNSRERTIKE